MFVPANKSYDKLETFKEEVRRCAIEVRTMNSLKAWVLFQISRLYQTDVDVKDHSGSRPDDLIIRTDAPFMKTFYQSFGKGGVLAETIELLVTEFGDEVSCDSELVVSPSPNPKTRRIEDLKINVKLFDELHQEEKSELKKRHTISTKNPEWSSKAYAFEHHKLFKVTVGVFDGVSIFANDHKVPKIVYSKPQFLEVRICMNPDLSQSSDNIDLKYNQNFGMTEEEYNMAKKLVGLPHKKPRDSSISRDKLVYDGSSVIFFRRKAREEPILYPFNAAVWLEARVDDVPARVHSVLVIFGCIIGIIIPVIVVFFPHQRAWDRIDRFIYLSCYFVGILSIRELFTGKGSTTTNVISGYITPSNLLEMSKSLKIQVRQLLLLARLGGAWTENLDHGQLCFLGRKKDGKIFRNEWNNMNHYAVWYESFNKHYAFTTSGVMQIVGIPGSNGAHCQDLCHQSEQREPFSFFDENEHYLAGSGPDIR